MSVYAAGGEEAVKMTGGQAATLLLLDERRRALEQWAAHIASLTESESRGDCH